MTRLVPAAACAIVLALFACQPVQDRSAIQDAVARHAHDVEVEGTGTVVAILPDDAEGSRHQRFLLRLESGTTVLIAHNVDLARRVAPLHRGDEVAFKGEYDWNVKGGLVHWTHHDPDGRHAPGWLKHDGETFQ